MHQLRESHRHRYPVQVADVTFIFDIAPAEKVSYFRSRWDLRLTDKQRLAQRSHIALEVDVYHRAMSIGDLAAHPDYGGFAAAAVCLYCFGENRLRVRRDPVKHVDYDLKICRGLTMLQRLLLNA